MAEVDTSSYPKPVQQNFLDTVGKLQQVQSNKLTIDKQKLDLVNQHYEYLYREIRSLGPNASAGDYVDVAQGALNQKLIDPDMFKEFVRGIPTDPAQMPAYRDRTISKMMNAQTASNWHYGNNPRMQDVGGGQQPIQDYKGAVRATGPVIPTGLPPTTPGFQQPSPQFPQGRVAPIGLQQSPGLPVAPMAGGATVGATPVQTQSVQRPNALPVRSVPPQASRQPQVSPGEPPPGFAQGEAAVGTASGEQLAKARQNAANFQREIFPLTQAIPALEKLGTKGTGPGTETINHIKSFILTNIPGVTEQMLSSVKTTDEAKKYLVDFVNQTGNSGTNDKLAAAFSGNPSINISNAAAVDVAKSALALRLMQQAQQIEFEKTGLPAYRYSKWAAEKNNQLDPRAFGVNYMSPEAKTKLKEDLKKNPKEAAQFEKSIQIAHDAGYIVLGKSPP